MIASLGLDAARLRMVKDGITLAPSAYAVPPSAKARTRELRVSPALVYENFRAGATIVLESLHKYWRPLTDFCRDLELVLGHRLQVNAYITPPGSQGFAVHRDDHDVFVLQVHGSKHWTVYERDDETDPVIDRVIVRGDSLYIPAGFPHAATTEASASAHLTVGILTHDAVEVVRILAKLAEEDPVFRRRLPSDLARDPDRLQNSIEHYLDEVRVWLDKVDSTEVGRRLTRRILSTAQPILRGQLRQLGGLDGIEESSVIAFRRGATCVLFHDDDSVRVLLADRELRMPVAAEPAMKEIVRRRRFEVRDLHRHLDNDGALVLVRRLVREGLLEVSIDA